MSPKGRSGCILEYPGVCVEPRRERLERNWVSASVGNPRPGIKHYSGQCQGKVCHCVPNTKVALKSPGANTKFPVCGRRGGAGV